VLPPLEPADGFHAGFAADASEVGAGAAFCLCAQCGEIDVGGEWLAAGADASRDRDGLPVNEVRSGECAGDTRGQCGQPIGGDARRGDSEFVAAEPGHGVLGLSRAVNRSRFATPVSGSWAAL
jgi:hypothetical protein